MKKQDFFYSLPDELIARFPVAERSASRMLCLSRANDAIAHRHVYDLPDVLRAGDLLVFNNTRVMPARLYGHKSSGGKVEILIERVLDDRECLAHVRSSKSLKVGARIALEDLVLGGLAAEGTQTPSKHELEMLAREGEFFRLRLTADNVSLTALLEQIGHMPLPPYIDRADTLADRERYQTVYSKVLGAVAAPTAGLHFDDALLSRLQSVGVECGFVTLHVGAGTFQSMRVDNIDEHKMHSERFCVDAQLCEQWRAARARGARVIAVGTTSVRCLESAYRDGVLQACEGETDIFIKPGYRFQAVDALITNFHLPESTLLMLVTAFAGKDKVMHAYAEAIRERYRFFSYGDAMFIV